MAWAPDYTTTDDLREFVTSLAMLVDADEENFPRAIAAASRAIDRHCRRQFGQVAAPEVRRYRARRRGRYLVVDLDDLMTTTGLLVAGEVVADPELTPLNAAAEGTPWTALEVDASAVDSRGRVEVTARWRRRACCRLLGSVRAVDRRSVWPAPRTPGAENCGCWPAWTPTCR